MVLEDVFDIPRAMENEEVLDASVDRPAKDEVVLEALEQPRPHPRECGLLECARSSSSGHFQERLNGIFNCIHEARSGRKAALGDVDGELDYDLLSEVMLDAPISHASVRPGFVRRRSKARTRT